VNAGLILGVGGLTAVPAAVAEGVEGNDWLGNDWLEWAKYTSLGLGALIDIPLSLAGDVVTLPIAYGRYKKASWATWWGEQDGQVEPASQERTPIADTSSRPPHGAEESSEPSSSGPSPRKP